MPDHVMVGMHVGRLFLLALVTLSAAACAAIPGVSVPPAGPIVTVEWRGGECLDGPCGRTVAIEGDGRVHQVGQDAQDLGTVPRSVLVALDAAIRGTDFAALAGRPFTGECPVNFDGQEAIYTFATPRGPVRLASCEVDIDADHPLFVAVHAALDAVGARDT